MASQPATSFETLIASHAPALKAPTFAERQAAVAEAQRELATVRERQLVALRAQVAELEQRGQAAHDRVAALADERARDLEQQLAGEIFASGEGTLTQLVAAFRREPTRQTALAVRSLFENYNTRALAELGEELTANVLGFIVAESIRKQPGCASIVNRVSDFTGDRILVPLAIVCHRPTAPADIVAALTDVETILLDEARIAAGSPPDAMQVELFERQRHNLTRRHLMVSAEEISSRHGAARAAEFARTYEPPPSLSERLRQRMLEGIPVFARLP